MFATDIQYSEEKKRRSEEVKRVCKKRRGFLFLFFLFYPGWQDGLRTERIRYSLRLYTGTFLTV